MINRKQAGKYCCEDISKIENYEQAVNDTTQTWDIHHRAEITQDGVRSQQDLIDNGLYWHVPAAHLIFLTQAEHRQLHKRGVSLSEEHKQKLSKSVSAANSGEKNPMFGKHHTEETKAKMRSTQMGNTNTLGMHWFNNGQINVMSFECPSGFVPGRMKKKKP